MPMKRVMGGMTVAEAAESVGVHPQTIINAIHAGKLKAKLVPGPYGYIVDPLSLMRWDDARGWRRTPKQQREEAAE